MKPSRQRPILITGTHRSGSTWVGKMIAASSSIAYIHEPFNIAHRRGVCAAHFEYWYTYIDKHNESRYAAALRDTLDFKYNVREELRRLSTPKDALRLLRDWTCTCCRHVSGKRPLLKDPIALFSAEWLAGAFDMDVVVLIRHPAAFAGSLKKANWRHDFSHFLNQTSLMQRYLRKFEREIEDFSQTDRDIVDQAILLWNLAHYMILKYRRRHPEWIFVKHETLSNDPLAEFEKIYNRLGLDYSKKVRETIWKHSTRQNRLDPRDSLKRDSKSNISTWKTRLTTDEINRVRRKTGPIADVFYGKEDWSIRAPNPSATPGASPRASSG